MEKIYELPKNKEMKTNPQQLNPCRASKSPRKLRISLFKMLLPLLALLFSFEGKSQYCNTSFGSVTFESILNVTFAGINNTSIGIIGGPSNYTTMVANVIPGTAYNMNITIDDDANDYVYVFIDWNQNGVLNDLGEVYTIAGPVGAFGSSLVLPTYVITPPPGALAGMTRMRVICDYNNTTPDPCRVATWGEAEDYSVNVIPPVPCGGMPSANSVINPASFSICPNSNITLNLANNYTVNGISYQWVSSTISQFGPWTAIPNATTGVLATPNLTTNTYFAAVITCTNSVGATFTTTGTQVAVSPVIISTIPYLESFETISGTNKLPNCSWSASNLGGSNTTYTASNTQGRMPRTGTKFATFYYGTIGSSYFYTNGIMMTAGITYSASLWYQTEYFGYNNWTDLSIMYGPTQTTTGLVTIASTNGPAISNVYKSLSNTFQVPTTGIYYVAIKGTTGSGSAPYLTWDDLEIMIPCGAGSVNTPTIALTANNTTICAGDAVNITAAGANSYTWTASGPFSGSNGTSISEMPMNSIMYSVMGTNTLTGCMSTVNQMITVNPTPVIFIVANTQSVCVGSTANLQALGASSYSWSNGASGANVSVAPTTATTYTVLATGTNGCTGSATQQVGVYPAVNVSATTTRNDICLDESSQLTAAGNGVSFQWTSNTSAFLLTGNPITVSPSSTSVYTVMATDANGCQKSATVVQNVNNCTGISEQANLNTLTVYPNPSSGEFSITTNTTLNKLIEVVDVTGKLVATSSSSMEVVRLNLKDLSNGVYYVKVYSNNGVEVLKVVKQ